MNAAFNELAEWVTQAGLIGRTESELMAGFCRRIAGAGVPLARAVVVLDLQVVGDNVSLSRFGCRHAVKFPACRKFDGEIVRLDVGIVDVN